jgi:surface carbohydrate biosynthesis protein
MIVKIKKFWYHFCYYMRAKKTWSQPKQSEVLIYDAANSEILQNYLKPWNLEILHVRGEQVHMWILLKSLFRKERTVDAYIDCFIEKVRPRLVVTTIDNKSTFYRISGRHPNIKTLFIQNGMRGYHLDVFEEFDNLGSDATNTFFVDQMLVFGSTIGEYYSQYIKGNIVPIGSIKNNFIRKEKLTQRGVIAFISHWVQCKGVYIEETFIPYEKLLAHPDHLVIQCLMRYAKEKNKRLIIIPSKRSNKDLLSQEKVYFRELMGVEPEFYKPSGPYPSYQAVDSAELVVGIDSTLGYESIARGKKTAIFSIRSALSGSSSWNYGWPGDFPDEGPFWTNKPDPDIFVRILDYLFEVSDEQWKKDVESTNFSSIMNYDPGNIIFQSIIEKELGPPPALGSW